MDNINNKIYHFLKLVNAMALRFPGQQMHKLCVPIQPLVSFCSSPLCNLTNIYLKLKNRHDNFPFPIVKFAIILGCNVYRFSFFFYNWAHVGSGTTRIILYKLKVYKWQKNPKNEQFFAATVKCLVFNQKL